MHHDGFKADRQGMNDINQRQVDRPLSTTAAELSAWKRLYAVTQAGVITCGACPLIHTDRQLNISEETGTCVQ